MAKVADLSPSIYYFKSPGFNLRRIVEKEGHGTCCLSLGIGPCGP
jgi:hypothetical protein